MTQQLDELVDPQDRAYVAGIEDAAERDVVLASLLRHRVAEQLTAGDRVPGVTATHLALERLVRMDELVTGRPVVLVFGSYT